MERDEDSKKKGYSANSYIAVLEDQLPTIYNPGMKFMQDNAPIHTAGKVKKWFEENGIEIIDWPPYSPDLNPIKIVWAWMKEWICEHYPDFHEMGKTEEAYQRFYQAINEAWEVIPQEKINSLIRTMDNRINAVQQAKGWHTKY